MIYHNHALDVCLQVCVSLQPGGRDRVVDWLANIQRKSLDHPAGTNSVARANLLLCRQWMGE